MKKNILTISLILTAIFAHAQNGLESIIVEKYYISDLNDVAANADGGVLPAGSVTYRIYADLLPGYKFQAAYGVPGHELRIETSTLFFNNEDRGATTPTYTKVQASHNTVMLDSWLSVGAACVGNYGILKDEDDGVATVVNTYSPPVLQNADPLAGIPLTAQDGLIAGTPEMVTFVGFTTEISVFDNVNDGTNGPLFSTFNGSWASLNGSYGPDTVVNKVLIAQITTNGIFSFELNIQIGTPSGSTENYVARNPVGNEIQIPSLIYNSFTATVHQLNTADAGFNIYPNPATNTVALEINSAKKSSKMFYAVYDEKGSVVLTKKFESLNDACIENVDISSLSSGQYIIELTMDGISSSRKIVKK